MIFFGERTTNLFQRLFSASPVCLFCECNEEIKKAAFLHKIFCPPKFFAQKLHAQKFSLDLS